MRELSNELLSKVLNEEVKVLEYTEETLYNLTVYSVVFENIHKERVYINVYQLSHMMKQWLDKMGYSVGMYSNSEQSVNPENDCLTTDYKVYLTKHNTSYTSHESLLFDLEDEPDEIIKLCEWVMEKQHER